MTCACGLRKTVCEGSPDGECAATDLPCGPAALMALTARVKERMVDAWRHFRDTPMVVPGPGDYVRPALGETDRDLLTAEALSWPRRYIRPLIEAERALGQRRVAHDYKELALWLKTQAAMTDHSLHFYLCQRAGIDDAERERVRKAFYRSVGRSVKAIVLGLVLDGAKVAPVPRVNAALQHDGFGLPVSQGQPDPTAQQADHGRARGHHDSTP